MFAVAETNPLVTILPTDRVDVTLLKVKVFEVENYICWGTPDDYETYLYWQNFFDKCSWHNYKVTNDITYNNSLN